MAQFLYSNITLVLKKVIFHKLIYENDLNCYG